MPCSGLLGGEVAACLDRAAEPGIQALDGIRRAAARNSRSPQATGRRFDPEVANHVVGDEMATWLNTARPTGCSE